MTDDERRQFEALVVRVAALEAHVAELGTAEAIMTRAIAGQAPTRRRPALRLVEVDE